MDTGTAEGGTSARRRVEQRGRTCLPQSGLDVAFERTQCGSAAAELEGRSPWLARAQHPPERPAQ